MNHDEKRILFKMLDNLEVEEKIRVLFLIRQQSWDVARPNKETSQYGISGGDDDESWKLGLVSFGHRFPAICYAYGISWQTLQQEFPKVFSVEHHWNNVKGPNWPTYENFVSKNYNGIKEEILKEILDQSRWEWHRIEEVAKRFYQGLYNPNFSNHTIHDQIAFINKHYCRTPKKVLDIGGGRGEIANFFKKLGTDCVSIEPGQYAELFYNHTGKHFFGKEFISSSPITVDLATFNSLNEIDQFDTIIFCESIEHVPESDFWAFWQKIKSTFNGLVIIVNWIYFHPIPAAGAEHIFEINNEIYDRLVSDSKQCIYRNHSHLVLQL